MAAALLALGGACVLGGVATAGTPDAAPESPSARQPDAAPVWPDAGVAPDAYTAASRILPTPASPSDASVTAPASSPPVSSGSAPLPGSPSPAPATAPVAAPAPSPPRQAAHHELNIIPIAGGDSDVGLGFG